MNTLRLSAPIGPRRAWQSWSRWSSRPELWFSSSLFPARYAINLQLLGGVWIIQTLPAIVIGLYTRWLHRWALLLGWAVGMVIGTLMAVALQFNSAVYPLQIGGAVIPGYAALYALAANLIVAVGATVVMRMLSVAPGRDRTRELDYTAALAH